MMLCKQKKTFINKLSSFLYLQYNVDIPLNECVINYINSNQDKVKYQKKLFRTIGWQKSLEKDKKYLKLQ